MHSKKHNYVYYSLLGIALAVVYFIQSATPLLPAFFGVRPLPAFVLMLCVAAYVVGAYDRHRWASLLNVPYLLWLLFAAYLNGYVVLFN